MMMVKFDFNAVESIVVIDCLICFVYTSKFRVVFIFCAPCLLEWVEGRLKFYTPHKFFVEDIWTDRKSVV